MPVPVPKFDRFAGTELQPPFGTQTVVFVEAIETLGVPPPPTVTAAAPFTFGSAVAAAMTAAVPAATAATCPVPSTVATAVLLELHVTVRTVTPAPASTDAARVTFWPTCIVTRAGETVTLCTVISGAGVVAGGTVTLSPQAA